MVGDSVIKKGGRECNKVIRSLVSGFPNEVDFALNVLTMMSFDKPESVPIAKVMLYMICTHYIVCVHVHEIYMDVYMYMCIYHSFEI